MERAESVSSNPLHAHGDVTEEHDSRPSKLQRLEPEGEYLAALRGSNSSYWQNSLSAAGSGRGNASRGRGRGSLGSSTRTGYIDNFQNKVGHPEAQKEPERLCPCGGGVCLVLTANTAKNPGRRFYRCPLSKEEGQCGFFEWCDNISTGGREAFSGGAGSNYHFAQPQSEHSFPARTAGRGSFEKSDGAGPRDTFSSGVSQLSVARSVPRDVLKEGTCFHCGNEGHWAPNCPQLQGYRSMGEKNQEGQKEPERLCPCGGGPCLVLTANTAKNPGRKFYRCPLRKEEGQCGFFEWCPTTPSGGFVPSYLSSHAQSHLSGAVKGGRVHPSGYQSDRTWNVGGSDAGVASKEGACFKCGNVGHWALNCPQLKGFHSVTEGHQDTPKQPQRLCPCGGGDCLVLTANTAKNQGRKFYRCPKKKEEGQCDFFEWCDNTSHGGGTFSTVTKC